MNSIKKDYKDILIAILIMGVISMTIVYANFTRRLQIVNIAKINNTNWDIHFENLVKKSDSNVHDSQIISQPVISNTRTVISGLQVRFQKPGDYISYTFDIYNAGDIDAKLYDYVHSTPICDPYNSICDSIDYTLKYSDGSEIKISDTLKSKQRRNVTMTIGLKSDTVAMPIEQINVSNLTAVFDYVQD